MVRLIVIVEGRTEETFVRDVLAPHLSTRNVFPVASMLTTKGSVGRAGKGGGVNWVRFKHEAQRWMKQEKNPTTRFTSMFDYYALPSDFPGWTTSTAGSAVSAVKSIEQAIDRELKDSRFIPYIQLHEFEALPLTDPRQFSSSYPYASKQIEALALEVEKFNSPEDIDLGPTTHPSSRIARHLPKFKSEKAAVGPIVVGKIGLTAVRQKCPHYDKWLSRLEELSPG